MSETRKIETQGISIDYKKATGDFESLDRGEVTKVELINVLEKVSHLMCPEGDDICPPAVYANGASVCGFGAKGLLEYAAPEERNTTEVSVAAAANIIFEAPVPRSETSPTASEPSIDDKLAAIAQNLKIKEGTAEFSTLRSKYNSNYETGLRRKKNNLFGCTVLSAVFAAAAVYFAASVILFWASVLLSGFFALGILINQLRHPLFYLYKFNNGAKCVWCGGLRCDLVDGRADGWYWRHRNKNGSRDKRYKDNYQLGFYYSTYDCRDCGARTECTHDPDRKPSVAIKVWRGKLMSDGLGVRASADFNRR